MTSFLLILPQAKKKNRKRSRVQRSASNPNALQVLPTTVIQPLYHSDGCIIKTAARSKHHQLHKKCENCSDNACTEVKPGEKRRANGTAPLQNLTNGTIPGSRESLKSTKAERKFSFRKFLRFQKRDSIQSIWCRRLWCVSFKWMLLERVVVCLWIYVTYKVFETVMEVFERKFRHLFKVFVLL